MPLWRGEARGCALWHSVRQAPRSALGLLLSAAMLGVQLWLFMGAAAWRALPVSLGYFLLPLVMVLAGRVFFGEQLSRAQLLSTLLAGAGVGFGAVVRRQPVVGDVAGSAGLAPPTLCCAATCAPTIWPGIGWTWRCW